MLERARADGLLVSNEAQVKRDDIVDWPVKERDEYVFMPVNTVVNAFHLRSLTLMAELAKALQKDTEAADYLARERATRAAFQEKLFDPARGTYRDGEGTDHAAQHANLFPLAFGLVPPEHRAGVSAWVSQRGMACSVYAAQYLLEGLFQSDAGAAALQLITAPNDRSWKTYGRKRHDHNLGGLGSEIQAEPGLESRLGAPPPRTCCRVSCSAPVPSRPVGAGQSSSRIRAR